MTTESRELIEGGCLCGNVRYRIPHPFVGVIAHCHCTMCRRSSGAAALTWVTVRKDDLVFTRGACRTYASSEHAERGFCPDCGSQISFYSSKKPDIIDVTIGTLDTPERFAPGLHIWTDTRLPWLRLDEHLPDRAPRASAPATSD
jgi:hypothetical protein